MIKDLEAAIGHRFQNITLLQNALTHSSYANERWHNSLLSNERLEFMGDSILGMVVAEYLYRNFPDRPEGELTRMRADMVCETSLAQIALRLDLGKHLLLVTKLYAILIYNVVLAVAQSANNQFFAKCSCQILLLFSDYFNQSL